MYRRMNREIDGEVCVLVANVVFLYVYIYIF